MAFELPPLPYAEDALEPHIDARTMSIHHDKHHAGYTRKLNSALEGHGEWQNRSIEEILSNIDQLPEEIITAVRNNGGGYHNHSLFWKVMSPDGGGQPSGELASAINQKFGSFEAFKEKFSEAASGRFGSGWGWLVVTEDGGLDVYNTPNQNSPLMQGDTPILGLDVWEHAYYLKYQNRRGDYVDAWWNVVNWDQVADNYKNAGGQ
ncbi:MAG: superoxide dismutase [Candidatus Promineifilaceae bacterium]|nr:superoxide dismutase [Candidatus Promineifilaceae bacterium]